MTPKCGWNVEEGRPWAAAPMDQRFAATICALVLVAMVVLVAVGVLCG